jgi:hypothetical protein
MVDSIPCIEINLFYSSEGYRAKEAAERILLNAKSYNIKFLGEHGQKGLKENVEHISKLMQAEKQICLEGSKDMFSFSFIIENSIKLVPRVPLKTRRYKNGIVDIDSAFYIELALQLTENFAIYSFITEGF